MLYVLQLLSRSFMLFSAFVMMSACTDRGVEHLGKGGELVVLTRNAPTTWYEGREGPAGPENDLVKAFAAEYKLRVRFEILESIDDILRAIRNNKAHLVAAGITRTDRRNQQGYLFGPEYQTVQQLVICRRGNGKLPKKAEDLVGRKIAIIAGSSYHETLKKQKKSVKELEWQTIRDVDTEQLLERVWKREIDCTLADSNIYSIYQRIYPELMVAFPASKNESLAWVLAPEWAGLHGDIDKWLSNMRDTGELSTIIERYYGHVENYDYVDISRYKRRIRNRLPKYRHLFKKAAKKYDLPWTLLAAQSYQESHWNARARSPTGVRGIMMLTLLTAKSLGVNNRLDATQSIQGGSRYLNRLFNRIPETVTGQDRIWYALAAYNVGFGHLMDARMLAVRLGKDPDYWVSLKEVLPLLSKKKYYKGLPHGYARGAEPVQYVQRIREYQQVLEQNLLPNLSSSEYGTTCYRA